MVEQFSGFVLIINAKIKSLFPTANFPTRFSDYDYANEFYV